ncbi:MAG TPA: thioesterase domain-containing protein [Polyangiales bacterium]|nr:thioesterase domain-containing protein [Polyangiales bacterium]
MSRLRVLQPSGTRQPLYCFTNIGGQLDMYQHLARLLGDERPVYGVKMIGSEGECEPLREIHQIASTHAADIRGAQPHGPYFLFGHWFGGVLAFEVARELLSHGERVGMVAMSNCPAPGFPKIPSPLFRVRAHVKNFFTLGNGKRASWLRDRVQHRLEVTQAAIGVREPVDDHAADTQDPLERRVGNALAEAYMHYSPTPLSVDVLFLSPDIPPDWPPTKFDDPLLGWGPVMRGRILQCQTPGSHLSMFDPGNVEVLVQHLRASIAQAERSLAGQPVVTASA